MMDSYVKVALISAASTCILQVTNLQADNKCEIGKPLMDLYASSMSFLQKMMDEE